MRLTSQGQIEATGFTLNLMRDERERQRLFHKRFYRVLLLLAFVIVSLIFFRFHPAAQ